MKTATFARTLPLLTLAAALAGCAAPQGDPDPRDPWEGFNRGVYKLNDTVDRAVLRPVAEFYTFATPEPARNCIHNMFSNLGDIWSAANSFLQGRGHDFVNTLGRFLFNSTMGVAGCFDVASANGARRIPNDFGVTLGVWGLGQGPYLVLPILGPSSVRDGTGRLVDFTGDPAAFSQVDNVRVRNSLWGLELVDTRAALLETSKTIDRTALDPYSFVRDAYLQRRAAQVRGANAEGDLPDYSIEDEDDAPEAAPSAKP